MAAEKEIDVPYLEGDPVIVRRRSPAQMWYSGDVPDALTPFVERFIAASTAAHGMGPKEDRERLDADPPYGDEEKTQSFVEWTICTHAVKPRITTSLDEYKRLRDEGVDVEHVSDRSYTDLVAIFVAVLGVAADLAAAFQRARDARQAVELVSNKQARPTQPTAADS